MKTHWNSWHQCISLIAFPFPFDATFTASFANHATQSETKFLVYKRKWKRPGRFNQKPAVHCREIVAAEGPLMIWNSRWSQSLLCETVYQFIADLMSRHYASVCPFTSSGLKMEKMLWWRGFREIYQTLYDHVAGWEQTFWAVEP